MLRDVYNQIQAADQTKVAAAYETSAASEQNEGMGDAVKVAADYDLIGRRLAHALFPEFAKQAAEHLPPGHGHGRKHGDGMPCLPNCEHHAKANEGGRHMPPHAMEEKKASILARMAEDPAYVSALVAKYAGRL